MHKTKDGKVMASLTEVKNKTGDIFAVVDEYGEISLTSYNKIRYKIIKVDINDVFELKEQEPKTKKEEKQLKTFNDTETKQVTSINDTEEKQNKNELVEAVSVVKLDDSENSNDTVNNIKNIVSTENEKQQVNNNVSNIEIKIWERNNPKEIEFMKMATKPLISN